MTRSVFDVRRRHRAVAMAAVVSALALSGCMSFPEGDTTCPGQGPNSPDWPYCVPAEPGGYGPDSERVDPTGPY